MKRIRVHMLALLMLGCVATPAQAQTVQLGPPFESAEHATSDDAGYACVMTSCVGLPRVGGGDSHVEAATGGISVATTILGPAGVTVCPGGGGILLPNCVPFGVVQTGIRHSNAHGSVVSTLNLESQAAAVDIAATIQGTAEAHEDDRGGMGYGWGYIRLVLVAEGENVESVSTIVELANTFGQSGFEGSRTIAVRLPRSGSLVPAGPIDTRLTLIGVAETSGLGEARLRADITVTSMTATIHP